MFLFTDRTCSLGLRNAFSKLVSLRLIVPRRCFNSVIIASLFDILITYVIEIVMDTRR